MYLSSIFMPCTVWKARKCNMAGVETFSAVSEEIPHPGAGLREKGGDKTTRQRPAKSPFILSALDKDMAYDPY